MSLTISSELRRIIKACAQTKILMQLGYSKERALKVVQLLMGLSNLEKNIIYRIIHENSEVISVRRKIMPLEFIKDRIVVVDGYNVLITVESLMTGKPVFKCEDGIIRDIASSYRRYRISNRTEQVLKEIISALVEYKPREVIVVYDSLISRSGELASITRRICRSLNASRIKVETAKKADETIIMYSKCGITATSDSLIISRVSRVVDIPNYIAHKYNIKVIDIRVMLSLELRKLITPMFTFPIM